ncbi:MAG: protein kinase [Sandaracinaceae bacterium]|nr:protein kinase [Sandaracinaceae bacterium]
MSDEVERRRVKALVEARLFGVHREPLRVGRFELRGRLGAGAMGIVYRAWDPKLDREVALKLVSPWMLSSPERARERLHAEARAMARLSHPNVAAVHEAGEADSLVYFAMERIEGRTLRAWLEEARPSEQRLLEVLLAAGEGLAAAHDAGLVHGDFKPENVIVSSNGVPKVVDFGLASAIQEARAEEGAGLRRGTPEYMAPEQWRGEGVDPRTDQYAFALVVAEALGGEHPLPVEDLAALERAAEAGVPDLDGLSRSARRALERALSRDPEERYPSMAELLEALRPRRRRLGAVALAAAVVLPSTLLVSLSLSSPADRCSLGERRVGEVYDARAQARIDAAFGAVDQRYAGVALERTRERLDAYARRWSASYRQTCEDVQSPELLDRRMACLGARRRALEGVVDVLADADAVVVARANDVVDGLPDPARCRELASAGDAPDPAKRERVASLDARLSRAQALLDAGQSDRARGLAQELLRSARALEHPPSIARAALLLGRVEHARARYPRARDAFFEALAAVQSYVDRELSTRIAVLLALSLSEGESRYEEALRWSELAARASPAPAQDALEAERMWTEAVVLRGLGRNEDALDAALAAYGHAARAFDAGDPRLAAAEARLGYTYLVLNRDEACEWIRRAYERRLALLGDDHPDVAESHDRMARCEMNAGRYAQAREHYERALAILGAVYPSEHRLVARTHLNFAWLLMTQRRYDEAAEHYTSAERGYRAAGNLHHAATCLLNLGHIELRRHRAERGLALLERARAELASHLVQGHPDRVLAEVLRGHALRELGRLDEALAIFERWAETPSARFDALAGIGLAQLERGRPAEAVPALEAALAPSAAPDAHSRAAIELHLARALAASGGDVERARSLAQGARAHYAALGPEGAPMLAEIDAWLARPSLESRASARFGADGLGVFGPRW